MVLLGFDLWRRQEKLRKKRRNVELIQKSDLLACLQGDSSVLDLLGAPKDVQVRSPARLVLLRLI